MDTKKRLITLKIGGSLRNTYIYAKKIVHVIISLYISIAVKKDNAIVFILPQINTFQLYESYT